MGKEFVGRLAFVTGGASGIGKQVCVDLANEGASVITADINVKSAEDLAASLPKGDGCQHLAIEVNVSKKSDVDGAVALVLKTYGRPADLIVNCAGIAEGQAPLEDLKEEDIDKVLNVNLKGTILVTQAFGHALLKAEKPGSIVNIASVLAWSPWENLAHYCASKAGVMQFTKCAAKEWGSRGVRVNSLHPGLTNTPLTADMCGGTMWKKYESVASMRRVGQPTDVSNTVLFLLSEKSGFVTGAHLEVSGQGF